MENSALDDTVPYSNDSFRLASWQWKEMTSEAAGPWALANDLGFSGLSGVMRFGNKDLRCLRNEIFDAYFVYGMLN